ncbi:MAG: pyrroline-5-carboxylate reductase, partial [Bauldia sp.]
MPLSSFSTTSPLVLVGAGKMGGALLKGWLDRGLDRTAVIVVDPKPPADSAALLAQAGIGALTAPPQVTAKVIVVAVKPQTIRDVLPGLRPLVGADTVTVSIAAGTTVATLAAGLGDTAIVRAMPNTPAQVGRGITALCANRRVDAAARALVAGLIEAVGEVVWVGDEALMDAITAVSGSGPAYVFLLAECL